MGLPWGSHLITKAISTPEMTHPKRKIAFSEKKQPSDRDWSDGYGVLHRKMANSLPPARKTKQILDCKIKRRKAWGTYKINDPKNPHKVLFIGIGFLTKCCPQKILAVHPRDQRIFLLYKTQRLSIAFSFYFTNIF